MRHELKMKMRAFAVAALTLSAVAAAGCGSDEDSTATPTTPPQAQAPNLPATSGSAVWDYLREVDYQAEWALWPGKGEKYTGTEPHGMLLTTYLNDEALEALNNKAGAMPNGSIIVKENYMPDGTYDAATIMYKVSGYDPANNDWFWAKIKPDGAIDAEGRVEDCAACHSARSDNDYIYTGELK